MVEMTSYPTETILAHHIPGLKMAELVQAGGQKVVYKATLEEQVIALKVLYLGPEVTTDERESDMSAVVGRARREVAILEQVDVPVLAKRGPLGIDTFQEGDNYWLYFTEEWIEGKCLRDKILEGRLSPAQITRLGIDLVDAIIWLSSRDLVHRDIKPANIMWAADRSRFVLLDPGIALDLHGPSLTQGAVAVGTTAYLSPEQMDPSRKRTLDFRSDLFAVGVVLYEAAVAKHPFRMSGDTPSEVLARILTVNPPSVTNLIEGFPQGLSDLISRLLGKVPHFRYRTCLLAREALEKIAVELGVEA